MMPDLSETVTEILGKIGRADWYHRGKFGPVDQITGKIGLKIGLP